MAIRAPDGANNDEDHDDTERYRITVHDIVIYDNCCLRCITFVRLMMQIKSRSCIEVKRAKFFMKL